MIWNSLKSRSPIARGRMNRVGKHTRKWERVRRQLVKKYAAMGITQCELGYENCWRDNALSFAHGRKRRWLREGELEHLAILACTPCHQILELKSPEEMFDVVVATIQKREGE